MSSNKVGEVKEVSNAGAEIYATHAQKAQIKDLAGRVEEKLIKEGHPPEVAKVKAVEIAVKAVTGNSANAGAITNNDEQNGLGKSKQKREITEGPTNVDGTAVTANNIRTGDQTNTDGNSDNNSQGRQSDSVAIAKAAMEGATATIDPTDEKVKFVSPALKRIMKMLENFGVTITPNIRKILNEKSEDDPGSLKTLKDKLEKMIENGVTKADIEKQIDTLGAH